MHRHQFRAIGKRSFHLNIVNHFGNTGHDLVSAEEMASKIHQLGHAPAIADKFKE